MEPYPIRLPDSLRESLQEEADDRDLALAEYIRQILRDRNTQANTQEDTQRDTQSNTDVVQRLDDIEDRLAALEEQRDTQPNTEENTQRVTQRDTSRNTEPDTQRNTSGETHDESRLTDDQREQIDAALKAGEYAHNRKRAEAITTIADEIRSEGSLTTSEIEDRLDDADLSISTAAQMWSETARDLDYIDSGRGSNKYRWAGE